MKTHPAWNRFRWFARWSRVSAADGGESYARHLAGLRPVVIDVDLAALPPFRRRRLPPREQGRLL